MTTENNTEPKTKCVHQDELLEITYDRETKCYTRKYRCKLCGRLSQRVTLK